MRTAVLISILALTTTFGAARAGTVFQHPAMVTLAAPVESTLAQAASPVLVGHPASPRWQVVHANDEHPAVTQARAALDAGAINPNTFLVQPPASVHWTVTPTAEVVAGMAE